MQRGDKVTYYPLPGHDEIKHKGMIKSMRDNDHAFVVFHCNNDWEDFEDYTAHLTQVSQLKLGWDEESEKNKNIDDYKQ